MNPLQVMVAAFGRICLSAIFIFSGAHKMLNWQESEQSLITMVHQFSANLPLLSWMQEFLQSMLPWTYELLILATVLELLGGVLVFLGFCTRLGAFLLLLFLVPTTLIFHHFWLLEGSERELQLFMFLKNLSVFGGLLLVLGCGRAGTASRPE